MKRMLVAVTAALCLAVSGCNKATSNNQSAGGVKTGPGVTDTTIKLGSLVDLTAVFASLSKSIVQGTQLFWKQHNAAGGVCGRKVEVVVKDHGYDPQKAVSVYREIAGDVLGMQTILGSPVMSALRPAIGQDNMFAGFGGWSASVLADEHIQVLGTTYDIEAIAGLDFLLRTNKIKAGDKVGHVYFEGDFGENAFKGSQYLTGRNQLTIVGHKIKASDSDLSAQVAALRNAAVSAILVSAGPTQTASVAGVSKSVGLAVPIVANGPGFTPQLLSGPAGPALRENLYVVSSMAPPASDAPAARQLQEAFSKEYPDAVPTQVGSLFGYVQARVMSQILQKACDSKDLTRQGLLNALHATSGVDTGGLVAGTLDYTKAGQPPSRAVYICQVDAGVPGGLKAIGGPVEAEPAKSYQP
ncbi:ABC transporter substrate-binding protein [Allorhizocola rhizosphaerae]|uniref:ABC transporter substrate-binding protein n=1 Tax=Allorhizocola rhizosphaerae TaxID=1872709 RepID=UPI000E3BD1BD|nr:ABC transporter substrate-binding protein [Allorhizocola rhizosphaerae]